MKIILILILAIFSAATLGSQTIVYHKNIDGSLYGGSVSMDSDGFGVNPLVISSNLLSQGLNSYNSAVSQSDTTLNNF